MHDPTPVPLGQSTLGCERHVCAFFTNDDEAYSVLLPFIKEGFDCGHRAVHVVSAEQESHHIEHLSDVGIDLVAARDCGQLDLRLSAETYLVDGLFDQDRMLEFFERMASGGGSSFPLSRIVCNMDWALGGQADHDALVEFEARVNDVWQRHDDIVICVYNLRDVSGSMMVDIMRTHPMVLIGDALKENPFYIPPEQFLRERRSRRKDGAPQS